MDTPHTPALVASALDVAAASGVVDWCAYLAAYDARTYVVAAAAGRSGPPTGALIPTDRLPPAPWPSRAPTPVDCWSGAHALPLSAPGPGRPPWLLVYAAARPGDEAAASLAAALAAHVNLLAAQVEGAVAALPGAPATADDRTLLCRLADDLARARRYGGGVSTLVCQVEPGPGHVVIDPPGSPDSPAHRALAAAVGTRLRSHLRQTDYMGQLDTGQFVVVLPEARPHEALDAGARLARSVQEDHAAAAPAALRLCVGAATFPPEVVDAGQLVQQAAAALAAARALGPAADGDVHVRHWLESLHEPDGGRYRCVCRRCGRVFCVDDRAQQRARRFCSQGCYKAARRAEEQARNRSIRDLRGRGRPLREIALHFGLTAERVRQICGQADGA